MDIIDKMTMELGGGGGGGVAGGNGINVQINKMKLFHFSHLAKNERKHSELFYVLGIRGGVAWRRCDERSL